MRYDPQKHHRRSIRLKGYDYSQSGWYFATICTQKREMLFGDVIDGKMILNDAGQVADKYWREIPEHYPNTNLDEYVIMPNHIHGIIVIDNTQNVGAKNISPLRSQFRSPSQTIGSIIRSFEIAVTKWFRKNTKIYMVWQRNYYEHIIRNENELNRIRKYIIENPLKWQDDKYFQKQETP